MLAGRVVFDQHVEPRPTALAGEQLFSATVNGQPIQVIATRHALKAASIVAAGSTKAGATMAAIEALEEAATRCVWQSKMSDDSVIKLTLADFG